MVSVGDQLVLSLEDFKVALKHVKDTAATVQVTLTAPATHGQVGSSGHSQLERSSSGGSLPPLEAAMGFCDDGINVEVLLKKTLITLQQLTTTKLATYRKLLAKISYSELHLGARFATWLRYVLFFFALHVHRWSRWALW